MFPQRKLLYHRGVDDHVGTYVTDYVFSAVCLILCIQLLIRIRREMRRMGKEQPMASTCQNILPWNWPKKYPTAVTMSTYAVLLLGFSNAMMGLLGGLTHQYLQTVEPYTGEVEELWNWLIIWRGAASFSACLCFSLLILTEQLLVQEGVLGIPRVIRMGYYITSTCACLAFYCYNYAPLSGKHADPFSIKQSFIVSFAMMFIYGIVAIVVLIRNCCCRSRQSSENDVQYSPAYSSDSKASERSPYSKELYSCCKTVAVHWTNNGDDATSRRWELFLTFMAPWIFITAGATNYFLKDKCADSDDAVEEFGCPLPNNFNHNAAMHVIHIFSVVTFFLAENLSMSRRRNLKNTPIRRVATSSTIYNDPNSCAVTILPEGTVSEDNGKCALTRCTNNNKPCNRDDDISETESGKAVHVGSDVASTSSGVEELPLEPMFPTSLNLRESPHRDSLYDNLSVS